MSYRLSPRCEGDLRRIFIRGAALFGRQQAEIYAAGLRATFALLADHPKLARERREFRPPVRLHPYQSHLIVYVQSGADILILRVLHGREDWMRRLHP